MVRFLDVCAKRRNGFEREGEEYWDWRVFGEERGPKNDPSRFTAPLILSSSSIACAAVAPPSECPKIPTASVPLSISPSSQSGISETKG